MPNACNKDTLTGLRVVPVTSWPKSRNSAASGNPTTPVAPARKILNFLLQAP
jgi:hypothetical protein